MPCFHRLETEQTISFLRASSIHDSRFEKIQIDNERRFLKTTTFNPIDKVKMEMVFSDVILLLSINDNKWGEDASIIDLTINEDYSFAENLLPEQHALKNDYFHFVFQMFSGNEIHILSSELVVK